MTKFSMATANIPTTQQSSRVEITNFTVHLEFIPQGQTVNQAYYMETLKRLREAVHRKRQELWPNDWIHHLKEFLTQKWITEMEYPPAPVI
jgi:hypothetical protein